MTKYFKSKVGNLISNGKTKVKFPIPVIATSDLEEIKLLKSSQKVEEISLEEAKEISPNVFADAEVVDDETENEKEPDQNNEPGKEPEQTGTISRAELEKEAKKCGISKAQIKKAPTKEALADLIREAQEKAMDKTN